MFQESLIASNPAQSTSRTPALVSITLQAMLVAGLLAVPLLHPDVLPLMPDKLTALAPPTLRVSPPPPPPPPVHMETSTALPSTAPAAPTPRAQQLPTITTEAPPLAAPLLAFGTTGPADPDTFAIMTAGGSTQPHIVVANPGNAPAATASGPLHISSGVTAGLLLTPIQPAYPPIARISHTEGSVVIQAVISKSGRIESAHVVSGPVMLQTAALAAVREARYRPFLLNNQPTEVETTITINFRLGS